MIEGWAVEVDGMLSVVSAMRYCVLDEVGEFALVLDNVSSIVLLVIGRWSCVIVWWIDVIVVELPLFTQELPPGLDV